MGKKRNRAGGAASAKDNSGSDSEDFDIINVSFEFFNFDSTIDFHGVKGLIRQLFDVDSTLVSLSPLTDLVVSQGTIGSAIKVDGKATDAYAFLTVLNPAEQAKPDGERNSAVPGNPEAVKGLVDYLVGRAEAGADGGLGPVAEVLRASMPGAQGNQARCAVVLSERLLNVPGQLIPPAYGLLVDELEAAVEDGEPFDFTHYLVVSKMYTEVQSDIPNEGGDDDEDGEGGHRKKKQKKLRVRESRKDGAIGNGGSTSGPLAGYDFFHPEDEALHPFAIAHGIYPFKNEGQNVADSKRTFQELGVRPVGHMILIKAERWAEAIEAVKAHVAAGG